jgi:hypothetical protein
MVPPVPYVPLIFYFGPTLTVMLIRIRRRKAGNLKVFCLRIDIEISYSPVLWIRIRIDFGRLDPDPRGQK